MDPRLEGVVRGALARLSGSAQGEPGESPAPDEVRITALTMKQLSRLAYLQAGDPLVDKILEALRASRPVLLDRPAVERSLGLSEYPPLVREEFARWFDKISGYGIALEARAPEPPRALARPSPAPPQALSSRAGAAKPVLAVPPEREILSEILGETLPEPRPCYVEPGKSCAGCTRCRTLGF